jgi:hypothetical protein
MTMAKLRLGKRDVSTATPTRTKGVFQGNAKGNYDKLVGHLPDGRSTAARSTGINPHLRDPIDPRMPNLSPA